VGTGNYNPTTARIYEDVGLLTSDPRLGAEINSLFNFLTGYSRHSDYRMLVVAPQAMRSTIVALVNREAALATPEQPGYIALKVNNLVDEAVIDALYSASQRGVRIDLVVRSICALRPGVPGLSETIRVRSIVGRFLEHSRIFYFRNCGNDEVFIGSADLMHRNLDRRVETLVRVEDAAARRRLIELIALAMADNVGVWTLSDSGAWSRVQPPEGEAPLEMQRELMRRANKRT
jgi:polyphosphate kinase